MFLRDCNNASTCCHVPYTYHVAIESYSVSSYLSIHFRVRSNGVCATFKRNKADLAEADFADPHRKRHIDNDVSPPSFLHPVIARHNLSAIGISTPSSLLFSFTNTHITHIHNGQAEGLSRILRRSRHQLYPPLPSRKSPRPTLAVASTNATIATIANSINQDEGYEVICFMADVGQEEDFQAAKEKALKIGASQCYIEDCRKEFVEELCFPAIACNAIYEVGRINCSRTSIDQTNTMTEHLPPRYLPRPPRHRPCPDCCRPKGGLLRRLSRLHWQGQRPGPLRAGLLRSPTLHQGHRSMEGPRLLQSLQGPQRPPRLRRREGHPRLQYQEQAVEHGREHGTLQLRGRHPRGPQRHPA